MSKTETAQQLAAAANARRVQEMATRIESVRQAKHQSVEDLAQTLEPLAQSMAALADETMQALATIQEQALATQSAAAEQWRKAAQAMAEKGKEQAAAAAAMHRAGEEARQAVQEIREGANGLAWRVWIMAGVVGVLSAALSGYWISQHQLSSRDQASLALGEQVGQRYQQLPPAQQREFGRLMGWEK